MQVSLKAFSCHWFVSKCQRVTHVRRIYIYMVSSPFVETLVETFIYNSILRRLNPFDLRVDIEGWWFEHSVSQLRVCLSAEGTKNVFWPWISPLRGQGSLTITFTGKFVKMARHFILLRLNPCDLRVDRERWWFQHSVSQLRVCLPIESDKNVS